MSTMVADLLPRIERSHLWFSENVELLFCAQIASSCHRSEGGPPILHILHILQKHPSQQGPIQSIFNKVVTSSVNKFVSQSVSESVSELLTWVDYDRTWVR